LDKLWEFHDPTTLNRQGPDVGSQYRSAVFYLNAEQQNLALQSIIDIDKSGRFKNPIVTEITAFDEFWPAEDYHQQYLEKRGIKIACV